MQIVLAQHSFNLLFAKTTLPRYQFANLNRRTTLRQKLDFGNTALAMGVHGTFLESPTAVIQIDTTPNQSRTNLRDTIGREHSRNQLTLAALQDTQKMQCNDLDSDLVKQTRFTCAADLDTTLTHYLTTYNHHIPQRALNHQSPIQALQRWQKEKSELFVKRVYKQAGLDIYATSVRRCARAED